MDFLIELILDIVFELGVEASKSKKVPKFLRIILISIIVILFAGVIGLIIFCGLLIIDDYLFGGIIVIVLGLALLVMSMIKFRKAYLVKKEQNTDENQERF